LLARAGWGSRGTLAVFAVLVGAWLAPAASAASWQALVTDSSYASSSATPIDLGANVAGPVVATGGSGGLGVAIAPDARTAYVVNANQSGLTGQITPVDLTSSPPVAEATIDIPDSPGNFIAITPDGRKAYMTDPRDGKVFPIDLTSSPATVGAAIVVGGNPEGIAFSPDGSRAYVAMNAHTPGGTAEVLPITVATDAVGMAITGLGPHPYAIAVTPDGTKAYVTDAGAGTNGNVYPVALPAGPVGLPISLGASTAGIAVAPDGLTAYAAAGGSVVPIDVSNDSAGIPIPVSGGAYAIAVTPDSKTVYVTNETGATVTPIDVATGTAGTAISSVGSAPQGIAITPDQAPVANFAVASAAPGSATSFDASSSTVRFGTIVKYVWDYGDGTPVATTSTPTTSHVYASANTYTATVTETDSAGTSVESEAYTGQTASSVGSSSARTTRTVVITNAPAPAVSMSANSLSFGDLALGVSSAPQTVRITNTGAGRLLISGSALSGAGAGEFALGADGCTGQSVAPSASCTVRVTFTPSVRGTANTQLAFADNASGSPHTVALTGTGVTTGFVGGTVADGSTPGAPPVPGASVQICPRSAIFGAACQTATTGTDGRYSFGDLAPGTWAMQVASPLARLFGASAILQVVAGNQTQDFTLQTPRPLPSNVTVTSVLGQSSGGVPTLFWNAPATISYPPNFASQPPNTEAAYFTSVALYNAGNANPDAAPITSGSAVFLVAYDNNATPSVVAQYPDPNGGAAPTVLINPAGASARAASSARAHATSARGGPLASIADLQPSTIFVAYANTNQVQATVPSPNQQTHGPTTITINQNTLRVPQGAKVTIKPNGDIVIETPKPLACRGARGLERPHDFIVCPTPLPQPPCSVSCKPNGPGGGGSSTNGNATYDPSGRVQTSRGIPLPDAKVVLLRSSLSSGPFTAVKNGSTEMSSGNRRNPDHTTALGQFGWDVIAGFYRVSAQHSGCTAARHRRSALTRAYPVPPPVSNLVLKLDCPHLTRSRSRATLQTTRIEHGRTLLLTVTVRGSRRHHPTGLVTFHAAGRTLQTMPISPRDGRAVLVITNPTAKQFAVRYQGDGNNTPSAAHTKRH